MKCCKKTHKLSVFFFPFLFSEMLQKDPTNFPSSSFPLSSTFISMAEFQGEKNHNETYTERISSLEWSKARKTMIEEQANVELQSLQLLYPNRFEYLKLELKSFIHLLQSQSEHPFPQPNTILTSNRSPSPFSFGPDTQGQYNELITIFTSFFFSSSSLLIRDFGVESSSCRKRRKVEEGRNSRRNGLQREVAESESKIGRRKDRVEVVLERAAVCLCKIRRFKMALFSSVGWRRCSVFLTPRRCCSLCFHSLSHALTLPHVWECRNFGERMNFKFCGACERSILVRSCGRWKKKKEKIKWYFDFKKFILVFQFLQIIYFSL